MTHCRRGSAALLVTLALTGCSGPASEPPATPSAALPGSRALSPLEIPAAERAIEQAVADGEIPGAVLIVGGGDGVRYRRAFGARAVQPARTPMTQDTIFDLASLTKPLATAASIMKLAEQGRLRLDDPVALYLPAFAAAGKQHITIEDCLLHRAGFIPDNALREYTGGREAAMAAIFAAPTRDKPREKFVYSDVGYIVLGEVVRAVSGQAVDVFAESQIFQPLRTGLTYHVPADQRERTAPTEQRDGRWMQGEVHDPRAHLMGGVAGHAGLFGTADDVARFARMMLRGGELDGVRVLSADSVARMTEPVAVTPREYRTRGFDCDTGYSSARGLRFEPRSTFGHTGFTGTMLWIDPRHDVFAVLLTNRVHPDGKGSVGTLRKIVMTEAAEAALGPSQNTLTGIDALTRDNFAALAGRRVALITNHTGLDRFGRRTADVLHRAPGVKLVTLMSPEHGLAGKLDEKVGHSVDEKTGLKVWSLYGESRRPTAEMLAGVDTLVFDIQDIGTRFYTYISTMGNAMQAAAEHKLRFVVLDRPNPIAPVGVDGPLADGDKLSFIAYQRLPLTHGMTVGELAMLLNREFGIGCDLHVVKLAHWNHGQWWEETKLPWVNPSPNMRSMNAAVLYPALGLLEFTNLSVGRGTGEPFERFGAPWIDAAKLTLALDALNLPGVWFEPDIFTPEASKFAKQKCHGVRVRLTDRAAFKPAMTGLAIAMTLRRLHGETFEAEKTLKLLANGAAQAAWTSGRMSPAELAETWQDDVQAFRAVREKYLLYP